MRVEILRRCYFWRDEQSLLLVAMPGAPSSFLFLVVRPGAPFVASLLLVAMPGAVNSYI